MSCVDYGWEYKDGQLAVTWDNTPVVAKASSGGCGCKGGCCTRACKKCFAKCQPCSTIHCKCKDCKTPHNNGGHCDKCALPVEEAKTATHDAESDSDSEEESELQFIGNEIDMSSCFDDID